MDSNLIQQSPHYNSQLRKISTLDHIENITNENENLINNSYLLLTNPGINNVTIKVHSLLKKINDIVNDKIDNNDSNINQKISDLISNYYTKEEIQHLVDNNHQLIYVSLSELESQLELNKSFVTNEYYNKDVIDRLLNNILNMINQNKSEVTGQLGDIEDELTNNTNNKFTNSRIDKLERSLQYIKNNVEIDNINKIIWKDYGIVGNNSTYIVDKQPITFTINKGIIIAKYNDETEDEDITNIASYTLSAGQLSDNIVTLSTNVSEGNHTIKVQYKNHIGENMDGTIAQINYKITKTKYNNYLWIVDSVNLPNIVSNGVFNNNAYSTYYSTSLNCPMRTGEYYNVEQIIKEKFYNNNGDISNNALYIILPSQYINLQNFPLLKIDGKTLKSNIFELNILNEEFRFNINEQANNITGYFKNIEYSVIKISETINSGIILNI